MCIGHLRKVQKIISQSLLVLHRIRLYNAVDCNSTKPKRKTHGRTISFAFCRFVFFGAAAVFCLSFFSLLISYFTFYVSRTHFLFSPLRFSSFRRFSRNDHYVMCVCYALFHFQEMSFIFFYCSVVCVFAEAFGI